MKFIHLRFWRSEVRSRAPWARINALAGRVLSGGSRGEPLPSPSFQRLLTLLRVGEAPRSRNWRPSHSDVCLLQFIGTLVITYIGHTGNPGSSPHLKVS